MEEQRPELQTWMNFSLSELDFSEPDDFLTHGFKFDPAFGQPDQGQLQIEPIILDC